MGCKQSSSQRQRSLLELPQERRRLSITRLFTEDGHQVNGVGGARGLASTLSKESLQEMLSEHEQRYSACSETDPELSGLDSYGSKKVEHPFPCSETPLYGCGYACHKGKKPETPNQDSWFLLQVEGYFSIYAVFDGHGQSGHHISNFVKENLPKLILRDDRLKNRAKRPDLLRDAFRDMQGMIGAACLQPAPGVEPLGAKLAGTTATVVIHDHENNLLTCAHVGDSGACLATRSGENGLKDEELTKDHKPGMKDERQRIEKAGGTVVYDGYANHRVFIKGTTYPGLNMSRCLGDLIGHTRAGISAVPDIMERALSADDKVLLVCSDGVWEFMKPKEVVELVQSFSPHKASEAAEALARESWNRWIKEEGGGTVDDITVLIVYLGSEVSI